MKPGPKTACGICFVFGALCGCLLTAGMWQAQALRYEYRALSAERARERTEKENHSLRSRIHHLNGGN